MPVVSVPKPKLAKRSYSKARKVSWVHSRKLSKLRKLFLLFPLAILCGLFLFGFGLYKKVDQNFVSADSYKSFSSLHNNFPSFSYIVVDSYNSDPIKLKKVNFVVLDKDNKKALVYDIPLSYPIDIPGKYSSDEFSKVFALGALNSSDKLQGGINLVNLSLMRIFGFKVDSYILVNSSVEKDFDNMIYRGSSLISFSPAAITKLPSLSGSFKTDFSLNEFYSIHNFINSLPSDRFVQKEITLESIQDTSFLDDTFRDLTLGSKLSTEQKSISVLNGTNLTNVAFLGSRIIQNAGGRVVAIGNTSTSYDTSTLITDDMDSYTTRYLVHAFNIQKVIEKREAYNIEEQEIDRSDVTLILGFDLSQVLY